MQDVHQIEQLETKIINSLRDHTIYNSEAQKKANYFSRILSKLAELRTIGVKGHQIITAKMRELSADQMTDEIMALRRKISPSGPSSAVEPMTVPGSSNLLGDSGSHMGCLVDLPSISSFFKDLA